MELKTMTRLTTLATVLLIGLLAGCSSNGGADCNADTDCPAGRYCSLTGCTYDCTFDEECPPDFRCSLRGRCERGCRETNGGVEACDGVDNDCDDQTDEDFPDLHQACSNGGCPEGTFVCSVDGLAVICDGPQPALDDATCDDFDDDCDGQTDEDAVDLDCPLQAGVCAGAMSTCVAGAGYTACDYGPDYTEGLDDSCDQTDNDCDGAADEDAAPVLEPEAGAQATDGLDNNCNGLIDEPGGVMVPVANTPGVWVDAFESTVWENPDCTGSVYGQAANDYPADWPADGTGLGTLYACSVRGVLPSAHLSRYQAIRACQAQGKRLCSLGEYTQACGENEGAFPYSNMFSPGQCNDPYAGAGQAEPTGTRQTCTTENGWTYDMSGNVAEWVHELSDDYPGLARVAGWSYACLVCNDSTDNCRACDPDDPDEVIDIHETLRCYPLDAYPNTFDPIPVPSQPFFGMRCCMDGP